MHFEIITAFQSYNMVVSATRDISGCEDIYKVQISLSKTQIQTAPPHQSVN